MDPSLYDTTFAQEESHWWFAARRAIVFDQLRPLRSRVPAEARILDVGCGTGRNLLELQRLGQSVGIDIEQRPLAYTRSRGLNDLVQASADRLPFHDETFEIVTMLDLLEHLDDDVAGASEVYRVLKPGGVAVIFVPAYRWLWGPQDDVSHHRRRYTPFALRRTLQAAGFDIVRLSHANLLLLPLVLAGRAVLRASRRHVDTENGLHPSWSNNLLRSIFRAELYLLRAINLPLGVSLLCIVRKGRTELRAQPQIA